MLKKAIRKNPRKLLKRRNRQSEKKRINNLQLELHLGLLGAVFPFFCPASPRVLTAGELCGVSVFLDLIQYGLPVIPLDYNDSVLNGPTGTAAAF